MSEMIIIYSILNSAAIIFQISLVFGAPLGEATLGGIFEGVLPFKFRMFALFQGIVLVVFQFVVLIRAKIIFDQLYYQSTFIIWYLALFYMVGSIINMITKSKIERLIWAPVNIVMFTVTIFIALS